MLSSLYQLNKLQKEYENLKIKILDFLDNKSSMSTDEYELYLYICDMKYKNMSVSNKIGSYPIPVKKTWPDLPESDDD